MSSELPRHLGVACLVERGVRPSGAIGRLGQRGLGRRDELAGRLGGGGRLPGIRRHLVHAGGCARRLGRGARRLLGLVIETGDQFGEGRERGSITHAFRDLRVLGFGRPGRCRRVGLAGLQPLQLDRLPPRRPG